MRRNDFEEEPPSYDHAFQANLQPDVQVNRFGKFLDASVDSFERGEMFVQAFSSQIDSFPLMQAQEVGQKGLLNCMHVDTNIQNNELFRHPKANNQSPAYVAQLQGDNHLVEIWPAYRQRTTGPLEDFDLCVQASHPLLTAAEYNSQNPYHIQQTQHYFEVTVQYAGPDVVMAIGLSTRPYPLFRMPGWNKFSVGYHSDDGHKFCDDATGGQSFGPSWTVGDTVGCGYIPETGSVYFTKNGNLIDYAFSSLRRHNYFPSIGADGPATIAFNFGRSPFKFNVQQWAGQFM